MAKYRERLAKWQEIKKGNRPQQPRDQVASNHRPANLFNGVLHPVLGYTIRGVIWYQGRIQCGASLSVSRSVPADDSDLA